MYTGIQSVGCRHQMATGGHLNYGSIIPNAEYHS
jgi:hypothetical protein